MDPDVLEFAQVMTIIVTSVASFIAIGLGARLLWKLGSRPPRDAPPANSAQLERLESTIELMAVEIERISESQRFTVNLLSERLPARGDERLGAPPAMRIPLRKNDTPH